MDFEELCLLPVGSPNMLPYMQISNTHVVQLLFKAISLLFLSV